MGRLVDTPQFAEGKSVERILDKFFETRGFQIEQTSVEQERQLHLGDRIFTKSGNSFFVEYKSGIQTYYTGNVFLETISVDSLEIPGWVYTCKADWILYATLLNGKILVFKPDVLRQKIEELKKKFRVVKTSKGQNQGYDTHGVIVPLSYAEAHLAEKVITL